MYMILWSIRHYGVSPVVGEVTNVILTVVRLHFVSESLEVNMNMPPLKEDMNTWAELLKRVGLAVWRIALLRSGHLGTWSTRHILGRAAGR